jgi:hypothetical protein
MEDGMTMFVVAAMLCGFVIGAGLMFFALLSRAAKRGAERMFEW